MWDSESPGLFVCTAGKARNLWGVAKGKQSYKSRHRADLFHWNFYNLNLDWDRCHHTHAHAHTHTPEED